MDSQAPAIAVLTPTLAALIAFLLGQRNKVFCFPVVIAGLLIALCACFACLRQVVEHGVITYKLGGWAAPRGIELKVDALSGIVLLVVAVVALLTAIYGMRRVTEETPDKVPAYWALFSLLCTGLLGIVIAADAFNVFVLLEVSSLTSYALIALGSSKRGTLAAFQYVIIGTMGASFYLLGVGYLYLKTGSLAMGDIHEIINGRDLVGGATLHDSSTIKVAFILMTLGIWIKMAFFPLHGWLSNAYTYSPSTTSCILAPLMTKVSVYLMLRIMFGVFGADYVFAHLDWSQIVVWLAVGAIVAGSLLALAQTKLKKMLCYLIVAEVGYMVGGAWLGTTEGLVGTAYHIVSDALMTLCLFIGASLFWRRFKTHDIDSLAGAFRKMPLTMTGFALAGLSMIGVPPTCGFFSKWYLIRGAIEGSHYGYVVALLFSSLVNAILFFRIFEKAYYPANLESADHHDHGAGADDSPHAHAVARPPAEYEEAPLSGLVALYAGIVLIFVVGLFNGPIADLLRQALPVLSGP